MKDDKEEGGRPVHLPLAWLSSSIFLFWFSSVCLRTDSFCAWWVSSSSLISADEQTKTEARPFSSRVFRLTLSDLFFETRADPQVCGGVLSFLTLRSSWPEFYFVFFSPQLFILCVIFIFYLLRCWHDVYTQTLEIVSSPYRRARNIGFDGFNFFLV
jgi:hypothetical protein